MVYIIPNRSRTSGPFVPWHPRSHTGVEYDGLVTLNPASCVVHNIVHSTPIRVVHRLSTHWGKLGQARCPPSRYPGLSSPVGGLVGCPHSRCLRDMQCAHARPPAFPRSWYLPTRGSTAPVTVIGMFAAAHPAWLTF